MSRSRHAVHETVVGEYVDEVTCIRFGRTIESNVDITDDKQRIDERNKSIQNIH